MSFLSTAQRVEILRVAGKPATYKGSTVNVLYHEEMLDQSFSESRQRNYNIWLETNPDDFENAAVGDAISVNSKSLKIMVPPRTDPDTGFLILELTK